MFSSTFLLVGKDMSLVSWEPETQVMSLLLESRIIPYFGARIHPHLFGMGPRAVQDECRNGENSRGDLRGNARNRAYVIVNLSIFSGLRLVKAFSSTIKSFYPIDIMMNIYFFDLSRNTTSAVCNQNASGFVETPAHHGGYLSDHFVAIPQNPTLGILLAVMLPLLAKRTDPSAKPPYILALTCRTGAS